MRWLSRMAMRMRMLFGRRRESTRLDDELGFHLDRLIAENIASGMSRDQARAAAMREFGNPALMRDEARATWSWAGIESLLRDSRFGIRTLSRTPGFAVMDGMRPAVFGLVAGLVASIEAGRMMRDLLYEIKPLDASVFAAVSATLLLAAALACLVPAWRASRLDPAQALRAE